MKLRCVIVAVLAMLVLAPAALAAGGSAGSGYGGVGGNVQNDVQQGSLNAASGTESGGSLPFTGLDLTLLVAGGMTLLVVGAGLRRATRHKA